LYSVCPSSRPYSRSFPLFILLSSFLFVLFLGLLLIFYWPFFSSSIPFFISPLYAPFLLTLLSFSQPSSCLLLVLFSCLLLILLLVFFSSFFLTSSHPSSCLLLILLLIFFSSFFLSSSSLSSRSRFYSPSFLLSFVLVIVLYLVLVVFQLVLLIILFISVIFFSFFTFIFCSVLSSSNTPLSRCRVVCGRQNYNCRLSKKKLPAHNGKTVWIRGSRAYCRTISMLKGRRMPPHSLTPSHIIIFQKTKMETQKSLDNAASE
jgi:hypothetical protein